jgi:hypothetical protein
MAPLFHVRDSRDDQCSGINITPLKDFSGLTRNDGCFDNPSLDGSHQPRSQIVENDSPILDEFTAIQQGQNESEPYSTTQLSTLFKMLQPAHLNCPQFHQFTTQDEAYLQVQFRSNPNPSVEDRGSFAVQLGVVEKQIRTWFSDSREREKCAATHEISANPTLKDLIIGVPRPSLSWERLQKMSRRSSSSQSHSERFGSSHPGFEGEPRIEAIGAASKHLSSSSRSISTDTYQTSSPTTDPKFAKVRDGA